MIIATSVKALLLAALAAGTLWRAATIDHSAAMFALRASLSESELVLILTLPAICLRLTAHLARELPELSASTWCERCPLESERRSWS